MTNFPHFGLSVEQPKFDDGPDYLGGKGAGLVWMSKQNIPVPPGFVVPTSVWSEYDKKPTGTLQSIAEQLPHYLEMLRDHFGYLPLLSVRSGAKVSMPGMLDTILNIGLDEKTLPFWAEKLGQKCLSDSYQRLITMYGSVVKGIDRGLLEGRESSALAVYQSETKGEFPSAFDQIIGAIEAVFHSWDNDRAIIYRKQHNIPREWGTAVVVQAMVFGNLNDQSGTGVLFTRNPDTGIHQITGEFLANAQGEDVVAGIRTPQPLLQEMLSWKKELATQLVETASTLEVLKKESQDVEFTIQDGKLFILQTRNAKRTPLAAVKIAVDMEKEGLITALEAVKRVSAKQLDLAQVPSIDPKFKKKPDYQGIAACSGIVTGKPVFSSKEAVQSKVPCILITKETTPDDIGGMLASQGVITMEGGLTSHAAVVARGENKPCITGVGKDISLFHALFDTDVVTMDGSTGNIWLEKVPVIGTKISKEVALFHQLVVKATGITPVIEEIPVVEMDKALLYLGTNLLQPKKAVQLIAQTLNWVQTKLYVDLTSGSQEVEIEFFKIYGSFPFAQQVVEELESILPASSQKKVVLIGAIKTKKFSTLGLANDLRSIILSDTEITLDSALLTTEDPAFQWVLDHKKKEGLEFVSLGVLVKGVKSLVSIQEAMRVVQNEDS